MLKVLSQRPAQAIPAGDMLRMEVSLEVKVIVVLRIVPELLETEAMKPRVLPKTIEAGPPGVTVM